MKCSAENISLQQHAHQYDIILGIANCQTGMKLDPDMQWYGITLPMYPHKDLASEDFDR
jgi:hypothetical protein